MLQKNASAKVLHCSFLKEIDGQNSQNELLALCLNFCCTFTLFYKNLEKLSTQNIASQNCNFDGGQIFALFEMSHTVVLHTGNGKSFSS